MLWHLLWGGSISSMRPTSAYSCRTAQRWRLVSEHCWPVSLPRGLKMELKRQPYCWTHTEAHRSSWLSVRSKRGFITQPDYFKYLSLKIKNLICFLSMLILVWTRTSHTIRHIGMKNEGTNRAKLVKYNKNECLKNKINYRFFSIQLIQISV